MAEGFGFQTLQTLQLWSEKTRAGLDQTIRRVVCPKPGLVGIIKEDTDDGENAISNTYRSTALGSGQLPQKTVNP